MVNKRNSGCLIVCINNNYQLRTQLIILYKCTSQKAVHRRNLLVETEHVLDCTMFAIINKTVFPMVTTSYVVRPCMKYKIITCTFNHEIDNRYDRSVFALGIK